MQHGWMVGVQECDRTAGLLARLDLEYEGRGAGMMSVLYKVIKKTSRFFHSVFNTRSSFSAGTEGGVRGLGGAHCFDGYCTMFALAQHLFSISAAVHRN